MRNRSFFRSIALLAVIALAIPVFAKPFSKTISLNRTAKVGRAELQAGEYRLLIDGNKATVQKGSKVVDRKSTRLNSSHVEISYAVFCLKKKKIDIQCTCK